MIDPEDTSGLALAALALMTAFMAASIRRGAISSEEIQAIMADAHALVHDRAGFVVDPETTQAADDFLSAAWALAQLKAPRRSDDTWPLSA